MVGSSLRDALGDALVRARRVVVGGELAQHGAQVYSFRTAGVEYFARSVPTRRSQMAFARGA